MTRFSKVMFGLSLLFGLAGLASMLVFNNWTIGPWLIMWSGVFSMWEGYTRKKALVRQQAEVEQDKDLA